MRVAESAHTIIINSAYTRGTRDCLEKYAVSANLMPPFLHCGHKRHIQQRHILCLRRRLNRVSPGMIHFAGNGRAIDVIGNDRVLGLQPGRLIRYEVFDLDTHLLGSVACTVLTF
jgi:hypothetical protein